MIYKQGEELEEKVFVRGRNDAMRLRQATTLGVAAPALAAVLSY
jgi:hypothetical protein